MSKEATDLIHKLVCDKELRLGGNGAAEIKKHPFFADVDWNNLRSYDAPWLPELESETDSRNFDKFEEVDEFYPPIKKKNHRKDGNFIGFTFKRENGQRISLVSAFENLEAVGSRAGVKPEVSESEGLQKS